MPGRVRVCLAAVLVLLAVAASAEEIYGLPDDPLVATVLGTQIHSRDPLEMQYVILQRLVDRYAEAKGIVVTAEEVDGYIAGMQRFMALDRERREARRTELAAQLQSAAVAGEQREALTKELAILDSLAEADSVANTEETGEARVMSERFAQAVIRQGKVNRALYDQYGGRIIYQQGGPEPLDAYRQFLEEQSALGDFRILDPAFEREFWRYYVTDSIHDFYIPGSDEEAHAFDRPFPGAESSR
jgi:hypothetical protein